MKTLLKTLIFLIGLMVGYLIYTSALHLISNSATPTVHIKTERQAAARHDSAPSSVPPSPSMTRIKQEIAETDEYIACLDRYADSPEKMASCRKPKKHLSEKPQKQHKAQKPKNDPLFIRGLYYAMIVMFAISFSALAVEIFMPGESNVFSVLSQWSVELAPMIGVIGTMYSMASFASAGSSGDVMHVFRSNIIDAVATTIVGIVFYALNSLFVTLTPEEAEDEKAA